MPDPARCSSPSCGAWTFNANGYCSDECSRTLPMSVARGIGCVTPPAAVRITRPIRVRRNEGYIARNGAFIASPEAGYAELSADHRELDRKRDRYASAAATSRHGRKPVVSKREARKSEPYREPVRKLTAADLPAIGDANH